MENFKFWVANPFNKILTGQPVSAHAQTSMPLTWMTEVVFPIRNNPHKLKCQKRLMYANEKMLSRMCVPFMYHLHQHSPSVLLALPLSRFFIYSLFYAGEMCEALSSSWPQHVRNDSK